MISAEQAMSIADTEATKLGWGEVRAKNYEPRLVTTAGHQVWLVTTREIMIGSSFRLKIDAETGEVLSRRKFGTR